MRSEVAKRMMANMPEGTKERVELIANNLMEEESIKRQQEVRDTSVLPKGVRYLTMAEQRTIVSMIMYDLMEAGFLNSKGVDFLKNNHQDLPDSIVSFVDLNYYIEYFFSGRLTKLAKPFEK